MESLFCVLITITLAKFQAGDVGKPLIAELYKLRCKGDSRSSNILQKHPPNPSKLDIQDQLSPLLLELIYVQYLLRCNLFTQEESMIFSVFLIALLSNH